ncbi:hypothetical protein ABPG72_011929 [Tetrahymena utriculariae]
MEKLWVDEIRPKSLDKLDYHPLLTEKLQKLAHSEDFPHLLLYGPNGAGKKTRAMAFLQEVYGNGVHKVKSEEREFKVNPNTSTTVEVNIISSNFHLDVTPADAENQDKAVIQKLIKEVASTHQLDPNTQRRFKVIIINEVDRLTLEAQASLRRTMEKYIGRCRLILIAENIGRVILPLRSRCLLIRVAAPSESDVKAVVRKLNTEKNLNIPDELICKFAKSCDYNLRAVILNLQTQKLLKSTYQNSMEVQEPEWKKEIKNIAGIIKEHQNPAKLKEIRSKFYDLLVNCIPGDIIIKNLMYSLLDLIDQKDIHTKQEIIYYAAHHENLMNMGSKPVFHLEAFAAQCMLSYKKSILKLKDQI